MTAEDAYARWSKAMTEYGIHADPILAGVTAGVLFEVVEAVVAATREHWAKIAMSDGARTGEGIAERIRSGE